MTKVPASHFLIKGLQKPKPLSYLYGDFANSYTPWLNDPAYAFTSLQTIYLALGSSALKEVVNTSIGH